MQSSSHGRDADVDRLGARSRADHEQPGDREHVDRTTCLSPNEYATCSAAKPTRNATDASPSQPRDRERADGKRRREHERRLRGELAARDRPLALDGVRPVVLARRARR